ncbi:MAG: DUF1792 domain-containing protein [Muribaculaceae bacterium]|nr:DUF1792 domain-containing protein [Muribaculaceae bacterium]
MIRFYSLLHNYIYANVVVPFKYWRFSRVVNVKTNVETINYILENHVSVSRYGDYEFMSINEETNNFQVASKQASIRLQEVIFSNQPNHIICIPHALSSTKGLTKKAKTFWKHYVANYGTMLKRLLSPDKTYFDASFTRFYMDSSHKDSPEMKSYITLIRKIWDKRDLYIIEGESTKFGFGNDFIDNASSVHRIICPPSNAFDQYDKILTLSKELIPATESTLILCALGMTATILAYDLALCGYQAIDIGHADIEYSWFILRADHKVPVEGKAVNECGVLNVNTQDEEAYLKQIIARIKV